MDDRYVIGCLDINKNHPSPLNLLIMKKHLSVPFISVIKFLIVLAILAGTSLSAKCQVITLPANVGDPCPASNTDFVFPAQVAGSPISIPAITATGGPVGSTVSMSITTIDYFAGGFPTNHCGPCTAVPIAPLFGITFNGVGSTSITLSTAPNIAADAGGKTIQFTVRAEAGGVICSRTYSIKIIAPVSLMLVLDGSGSMGWGYDGSFSPPANSRRWDGLRTGVSAFTTWLTGLNATLINKDSLGLRYFSTCNNSSGCSICRFTTCEFTDQFPPAHIGQCIARRSARRVDRPWRWNLLRDYNAYTGTCRHK
jgi:hypothetical protein